MCLVIATVLFAFGISFYLDGNLIQAGIFIGIATPLLGVFVWRVYGFVRKKNKPL